ncbi:MAG: AsnC family transcriptional regulator [Promethearchaeati archaeon SRVP18_Atabeyarchaeia-1]
MDKTDIFLALFLMANSRTPYSDLAEKLGLSVNAVHKRIQTLRESGIIKRFTATISLSALKAVNIIVFGGSETQVADEDIKKLQENDRIYWVAVAGGNYLYVGGYLRSISELDQFVAFVKTEAKIAEPTVGIVGQREAKVTNPEAAIQKLDYRIIYALRNDSRRAIPEISEELGVSAKTIRRRLARLISEDLVELGLEWYPDKSNDIMTTIHIELKPSASKGNAISLLTKKYSPNVLFCFGFSNLPNLLIPFVWTNSMKELQEISKSIQGEEGFERIVPHVLYTGYIFDTWRDKLAIEKGASTTQ